MSKILFTCGDMTIGGVQKSLISLLNSIDYKGNMVYLMLNSISGELLSQVPKEVHIIKAPDITAVPTFNKRRLNKDLKYLLKHPESIINYTKSIRVLLKDGSKRAKEEFWILNNYKAPLLFKDHMFDVAISYAGGIGVWNPFVIDSVAATKKVCWLHGDYNKIGTKSDFEKKYYLRFDEIVVVSKTVEESLIKHIPELRGNVTIIPNLIDKMFIRMQAKIPSNFIKNHSLIHFVSISRLDKEKGFDLALQAFYKSKKEGIKFKWTIVGDGNERKKLENLIKKLKLTNMVEIIGFKSNPYPYLKNADVFFHPSKSEGFGLVVAEAKLLAKPILITNYPSVSEQIEDGVNGVIVPITEDGIFEGIRIISSDENLRKRLAVNLEKFSISDISILKFKELLKIADCKIKLDN